MSQLDELRRLFPMEAKNLEKAGFTSDSDLRSLDPTDLQELFPGVKTLKTRYDLFNRIHSLEQSDDRTSRTRSEVLKKIEIFSPDAARTLKEQGCLDYLDLLDRVDLTVFFPGVEKLKQRKKIFEIIHPQMPVDDSKPPQSTTDKFKKMFKEGITPLSRLSREVCYQKLESGKSLKVSKEVMKKVTSTFRVRFKETATDHKVSILLCPVSSRIGSDAEIAIASIKDDKPVILVFLIHSLKPQPISVRRFQDESKNIVLSLPLFHHDTKWGLLRCKENDNAIADIQKKLLEYSKEIIPGQGGIDPDEGYTDKM